MKKIAKSLFSSILTIVLVVPTVGLAQNVTKTAPEISDNLFVTLTFHDVRDDVARTGDRDVYAISTKNLAQYFAWIQEEGWHPIRLEDVWQARQKKKPLPAKSVLLTFDDGALSSYTRVFPLLKQYDFPAVFAIPTSWINGNTKDADQAYGEHNLMNWDQMREMQQSGLTEFVSHSDNMHKGIVANPQNSMQPAAITREYSPMFSNYESDEAYSNRVFSDLKRSKETLDFELGINSLAIFWPYGAVTKESEEIAVKAGLPMSFSLGSMSTLADSGATYQRGLIMNNPSPEMIHEEMMDFLTFARADYKQRKSFIRFDLAEMLSPNNQVFDQKLGRFLNQINSLSSNTILLQTVADQNGDGKIDTAYFPNQQLKMSQDLLNRTVWQARTRINNRVYAELPVSLETKQGLNLAELTADLVKNNSSIEGLMIETGDEFSCAIENKTWDAACIQKINQVFKIKERTKDQAKYYTNISNNYQTALKMTLKDKHIEGLKPLLEHSLNYSDYLYLDFDPVNQPEIFKAVQKQLEKLSDQQKQRLIFSFTIDPNASKREWKRYQRDYQVLKKLAIQKIGINNYQLAQGQRVQENLYRELSSNNSPLTYLNPYEQANVKERK
ncbi:poly-beta-1,6-N-acetyl-D-glucosamine N-deacetylase PgaB [Acinetobacter bohemicus ANC 3994]|uniref:Poly-beta-1,6-N-acetyl-D-glucosamine N-deacetylase PgaB n=1 Tax=Acinetobacter bohemicus ANC 3994 TaxID=1217715 RepID=N8P2B3_9GAMM|nr:poly-beta-1,6-N-acetyl-D-glucosamine N-deacetylase PgaB [Acinetobacter bohemicus]ENU20766.1 poly-beta-1,6-N-acetyl-D-glucosamine N-deacetylase PgaB [Acinetobacter bohemicus ANC 3994]